MGGKGPTAFLPRRGSPKLPVSSCVLVIQSCPTLCNLMQCSPPSSSLYMEFSRQEYWSGLSFPSPGDLPNPGIEPRSPALQADALLSRRRQWHPTPVLLPGKSHGWRSLVGCSPWGREESDTTERFHFHFSLSCIGEGNGNPLQCSCLENPRDGAAWWAAVYGIAQSRTRLKLLRRRQRLYYLNNQESPNIQPGG